jgi:hypothetical protein
MASTAAQQKKPKDTVTVTYNGVDKEFRYHPNQKARVLLDEAIRDFNVTTNPHMMGLFTTGDVELKDDVTLEDAGVVAGQLLVLRVSAARGGAK